MVAIAAALAIARSAGIHDTTNDPLMREMAEKRMPTVRNAEEIRNSLLRDAAVRAGTYQNVIPLLQCVKDTGARLEARFGYHNPNSFVVYNPAGHGNLFTPAPEDRGQPTRFLPGAHEDVVTVVVEGKRNDPQRTITWTLDYTTVPAPAENVPRCKGSESDAGPRALSILPESRKRRAAMPSPSCRGG